MSAVDFSGLARIRNERLNLRLGRQTAACVLSRLGSVNSCTKPTPSTESELENNSNTKKNSENETAKINYEIWQEAQ